MLEQNDIDRIIEAHKNVFATKADIENLSDFMRTLFSDLQTSVDGYAKKADTYFQEMAMLAHKVDRLEKWLLQLAAKAGIKLEYS